MVGGEPVQVIHPAAPVPLPVIDLRALPAAARARATTALVAADAARPFDRGRAPLLRLGLVRWGAAEHVLLVTMHHIVSDGWSIGVLTRELTALYRARQAGEASPLAALPVQYADYAVWQRSAAQAAVQAAELRYWQEQVAGVAPLAPPTDRGRPAAAGHQGAGVGGRLDGGGRGGAAAGGAGRGGGGGGVSGEDRAATGRGARSGRDALPGSGARGVAAGGVGGGGGGGGGVAAGGGGGGDDAGGAAVGAGAADGGGAG